MIDDQMREAWKKKALEQAGKCSGDTPDPYCDKCGLHAKIIQLCDDLATLKGRLHATEEAGIIDHGLCSENPMNNTGVCAKQRRWKDDCDCGAEAHNNAVHLAAHPVSDSVKP